MKCRFWEEVLEGEFFGRFFVVGGEWNSGCWDLLMGEWKALSVAVMRGFDCGE